MAHASVFAHRTALHGISALAAVAPMPAILQHDLQIKNRAAAGLLFFELAILVAVVIVATRRLASHKAMMLSLALMIPAAASVVVAQVSAVLWVMVTATAIVAVSSGLGYRGSLQVVNQIAPGDKRAAVVSSYFICCFIGNALPVVGVGLLSSVTGMVIADMAFAGMIAAFAVVALIFATTHRR